MPDNQLDWMDQGPLSLSCNLHYLPKHPKTLLTKYDPDKKVKDEDHIDDFNLHLRMLQVRYDDISCRLFVYTLDGRTSIQSIIGGSLNKFS